MTQGENRYISTDPAVCGGRPHITGTRITVDLIRDHIRAGYTAHQIAAIYPHLTYAQIEAAIREAPNNALVRDPLVALYFRILNDFWCRPTEEGFTTSLSISLTWAVGYESDTLSPYFEGVFVRQGAQDPVCINTWEEWTALAQTFPLAPDDATEAHDGERDGTR